MKINAKDVKELSDLKDAVFLDCKKALQETKGDIEKAIDHIRKIGLIKAEKKAGRTVKEGVIHVAQANNKILMIEINCETDFVAKSTYFVNFVNKISDLIIANNIYTMEELQKFQLDGVTIENLRQELVAKIGENMQISRFVMHNNSNNTLGLGHYVHFNKIGGVVVLDNNNAELAYDLAVHVVSCQPLGITTQDIDKKIVAKEKEIFIAQAKDSGKPEAILEKIINGKLNKFLQENSMENQIFYKENDITVKELLAKHNTKILHFTRFELGELINISTESKNFAEEVRELVKG